MHLSDLKLWNYRKYGCGGDNLDELAPAVAIPFNPGLNVLVGENDSGKTAIVDAIRHLLGTQSRDWNPLVETDFYGSGKLRATRLKVEAVFRGFDSKQAAPFLEWIGFEKCDSQQEYVLTIRLTAERKANRIITNWRAGADTVGAQMDGEARELLRITYLKPLRDAESELTPGRRSRFAQILAAHKLFQPSPEKADDNKHELETIVEKANADIADYFTSEGDKVAKGVEIMQTIGGFLEKFFPQGSTPNATVNISGGGLSEILRRLELAFADNPAGLGSLNLLYIAAELLLLQSVDFQGLRLGIIEELEAHVHAQGQLRLIEFLREQAAKGGKGQFILTTHSTTLGASINLKNLLICKDAKVFPMGPDFTMLKPENYGFLQRFLDATKANLFFARGVILVEGDAENILLPTVARLINRPLHRYGVSVVNVGSTAFLHYARIFQRKDKQCMGIPVAVVTDMDVRPLDWKDKNGNSATEAEISKGKEERLKWASETFNHGKTKAFVSPNWTLEYELALSPALRNAFYYSILMAEKIKNSKTGLPAEGKTQEVTDTVKADFTSWQAKWKSDTRKNEKIAFAIYKEAMLDKQVSKAITAQVFAEKMVKARNHARVKCALLNSPHIDYLIEAICHVTELLLPENHDAPDQ
jgi:putative ATP-dependent endonuclease of OLD family